MQTDKFIAGADPEILKGWCTKFPSPKLLCFRIDFGAVRVREHE